MQQIPLDRQDARILELLQENCRLPRDQLAEQVSLSPSQCFRRLKRLEESGLISRFIAVLDHEKAGFDVTAMVMVQYRKSITDARQKLLRLIEELDIIQEAYAITGADDFLLKVSCRSMRDFNQLINRHLSEDFISGCHSYMLMECVKFRPVLPLSETSPS